MTGELRPQTVLKTLRVLICMLLGFSHNDCEGVARLYVSGHIRIAERVCSVVQMWPIATVVVRMWPGAGTILLETNCV